MKINMTLQRDPLWKQSNAFALRQRITIKIWWTKRCVVQYFGMMLSFLYGMMQVPSPIDCSFRWKAYILNNGIWANVAIWSKACLCYLEAGNEHKTHFKEYNQGNAPSLLTFKFRGMKSDIFSITAANWFSKCVKLSKAI